ncbi:MAG: GNAT family N-acetyltransferase [Pseudomonadota bacterium]
MTDMLVKLYDHPLTDRRADLARDGVKVCRALTMDRDVIVAFARARFGGARAAWAAEVETAVLRQPSSCVIATADGEVVGFACWDATAKGVVGPIGVHEKHRGKGVAREMMRQVFEAMRSEGYAYAVIGWVQSEDYYRKACGAVAIEGSHPGVYERRVGS